MKISILASLFLSFSQIACANHHVTSAKAELTSPKITNLKSEVTFLETKTGIKVDITVSGLKAGAVHGFHVHEKGECKGPDFKSAGDHYNPTKHPHASPASTQHHQGDLGNLVANKQGIAKKEILIKTDKNVSLSNFVGRALILHANPDDFSTQPSGDAGDRIACGIITPNKG